MRKHKIKCYVNQEILNEYIRTSQYFKTKYITQNQKISLSLFVKSTNKIQTISNYSPSRDIDDNKFINCAIDPQSEFIIKGDIDLLDIKNYKEIKILTPSIFLELYNKKP